MTYTVRFESNAFQADSAIAKLVGAFDSIKRTAQRLTGTQTQEFQGDQLRELFGVNQRTMQMAMDWADSDFDAQITIAQWDWKGRDWETQRRNGQKVTEPRNIVDTGNLLASKKRIQVNKNTVDFTWTADYAGSVHDGGVTKKGESNPARPWTEPTLAQIDTVISATLARRGRK